MAQVCDGHALEQGCLPADYHGIEYANMSDDMRNDLDITFPFYKTNKILNNNRVYITLDGAAIILFNPGMSIFLLDVNGKSGPNKWGWDIFPLMVNTVDLKIVKHNDFHEDGGYSTSYMLEHINEK